MSSTSPVGASPGRGKSKKSFVEIVLDELLQAFDQGRIQPGERINAAGLSERLGMSRGPVREALHYLAGQGLILLEQDRGAVLRPMSRTDILQMWDVLEAIVSIGVSGAAERIRLDDNTARVRASLERIIETCRVERTFRMYLPLNDFHYLLNDISGNPHINLTLDKMFVPYWNRYLTEYIDIPATAGQYAENYRRIAEGVLAGDGPAAAAAFSFHVRWSKQQIIKADLPTTEAST